MPTFACPHCGVANHVPDDQTGRVVSCAACRRAFRSDVPPGAMVGNAQVAPRTDSAPADGSGNGNRILLRLRPAVWRMRFAASVTDAILMFGGLALVIWAATLRSDGFWFVFFLVGGLLLWLVGFVNLLAPWVGSRFESLEVTEEATRWRRGFLKRRSIEIRHDRLRAVDVEQSLFERMLGVGTLKLPSDGNEEDEIVMRGVPDPKAVAQLIRERMGK